MDELTVSFTKEKETKNAWRFKEVLEEDRLRGVVGTLYVMKGDLNRLGNPNDIVITIRDGGIH